MLKYKLKKEAIMGNGDNIFCSDEDFRDFLGSDFAITDKTAEGLIKKQLAENRAILVTVPSYIEDIDTVKAENPIKNNSV